MSFRSVDTISAIFVNIILFVLMTDIKLFNHLWRLYLENNFSEL
jgi:hypothetical protein